MGYDQDVLARDRDVLPGGVGAPVWLRHAPGRHRNARAAVAYAVFAVAVYTALAVVLYWHVWSSSPTSVAQPGPDMALNTWFLAWGPHALIHGHNPLFTTYGNYPYGVNVLDDTSELLLGTLLYPVTVVWGPLASFNVAMTSALALSALSAYTLARRLVRWWPAAFVAGLLYGFSPYMIAETYDGHLQLTFMALPPLVLLALHEIVVRQRGNAVVWGAFLGLLLSAQFFISVEVFATTAVLSCAAIVVTSAVAHRWVRSHLRHAALGLGCALGVAAALLAYPGWFLAAGPGSVSGPIQLTPQGFRNDLLGPLLPDSYQWIAPFGVTRISDHFATSISENGAYLGIPLLVVLAAGAIWLRRRAMTWVLVLSWLVAFVLSLGGVLAITGAPATNLSGRAVGGLSLPGALFERIPVLANAVPSRFAAYAALFAALLLAVILDELRRRGWRVVVPAALAVVCLVPLVPSRLVPVAGAGIPWYLVSPAARRIGPGSVTILLPYPGEENYEVQLWQVEGPDPFRFRMPGGYFAARQAGRRHTVDYTPHFGYVADTLTARTLTRVGNGAAVRETPALRRALRLQWRTWHVANVVAPMPQIVHGGAMLQFLTWLLGPPSQRLSPAPYTYAWYGVTRMLGAGSGPVKSGLSR